MSPARIRHANIAIASAAATLKMVLDDPYLQAALVGVPLYIHSMMTFAAVFLLKIAAKDISGKVPGRPDQLNSIASAHLNIGILKVRDLVGQTVDVMISCSERASKYHLSHHIARGLGRMLASLNEWEKRRIECQHQQQQKQQKLSRGGGGGGDVSSMFPPISTILGGGPNYLIGSSDTVVNHPPSLALAPLSAERSSGSGFALQQDPALTEGSLNPTITDWWGFDEDYFPMGVYDFLQSQMPA